VIHSVAQGFTTVLESVCQMAVASAGGVGLAQEPAMLMEELITTES